ncbi:MAG: D-tyrosyl-tRNA(Tyr) deacylase [Chloroflexi bacterium]|nr:D-tyrosyl-tRNA(Tyr) deacylase [Chloroflexota bacterium]
MRALVQRVSQASVTVEGKVVGQIGRGLVVLVGVARDDTEEDVRYLFEKLPPLRVFPDAASKFNLSAADIGGGLLMVSQFTLMADTRKGRRPSFDQAAPPELAQRLFDQLVGRLKETGLPIATGQFGAHMVVEITNDGPVTVLLDSRAGEKRSAC